MEQFASKYLNPDKELAIADVGSADVSSSGVNGTYRPIFKNLKWKYVGIDLVPGPNVDIVVPHPYNYSNIEDDTYHVAISGQTLEHVGHPFQWMRELNRILKPRGIICIICPWFERLHEAPTYKDYWRVLPSGMELLLKETGFKVLEVFQGRSDDIEAFHRSNGIGDTVGIGQKEPQ